MFVICKEHGNVFHVTKECAGAGYMVVHTHCNDWHFFTYKQVTPMVDHFAVDKSACCVNTPHQE